MGWAVENGSKMRDVVHLSCYACLTLAEKEMHAANIIVFLRLPRATLFSGSEGQELVVKDVCFSLLFFTDLLKCERRLSVQCSMPYD